MNRRGFLSSCLALAAAPAIVRADSLMRIVPREAGVLIFDGCDQWMEWTQVVSEPVIVTYTGTFAEIMAQAFRDDKAEIAENIERNNALLRYMMKQQLRARA